MLRHLEIFTLLFHHGLLEAFIPPGSFGLVLGHLLRWMFSMPLPFCFLKKRTLDEKHFGWLNLVFLVTILWYRLTCYISTESLHSGFGFHLAILNAVILGGFVQWIRFVVCFFIFCTAYKLSIRQYSAIRFLFSQSPISLCLQVLLLWLCQETFVPWINSAFWAAPSHLCS